MPSNRSHSARAIGALTAFAAAILSGTSLAATKGQEDDTPILLPTEMCRGYPFVEVTLTTSGDTPVTRTFSFLYDTGASSTFIDKRALEEMTGRSFEAGSRVNFSTGTIGELDVTKFRARVRDFDTLSMALGRRLDGILAFDAFGDFLVTIDYEDGEVRLARGDLPRPDNKTVFSTRGGDPRPWIRLRVGNKTRRVLVDSGSATSLAVRDLERYPTKEPKQKTGYAVRIDRLEPRHAARLDGDVTIGASTFEDPILYDLQKTELLGNAFLSKFELTLDADDRRLSLNPYEEGPFEMPALQRVPFATVPTEDGLEVLKLLDVPGAEIIDIQEGDILTHINGIPVAERGCGLGVETDTVTYTLRRGDNVSDVTVQQVTLVE